MYLLYTFLYLSFLLVMLPVALYRAWRYNKYLPGLTQRLGYLPDSLRSTGDPTIWIHACSVGETLSAQALAQALHDRFPETRFVFSTITRTGQEIARVRFAGYGEGRVCYFPLDLPRILRHFFDWIQPTLLITIDTEIWPNFLHLARRRKIPVVMVNGRISDESFPKYRLVRRWMRRVLDHYTLLLMKSEEDAERIRVLGAPTNRVEVGRNIKYDKDLVERKLSESQAERLQTALDLTPEADDLIVAGSTHEGEERILLQVLKIIRREPGLEGTRLLIVPRHPERFDKVAKLARREGFRVRRRSDDSARGRPADVLILDTLGELATAYRFATVAFVGGSLIPHGGQSIMEPALYAKPIVVGPSMRSFPSVAEDFLAAGGLVQISAESSDKEAQRRQLSEVFIRLLRDRSKRRELGLAARSVLESSQGAVRFTVDRIAVIYQQALDGQGA